jgi:hypothetical protein
VAFATAHSGSPFWRSLHKIKSYFKLGAKYSQGNGRRIRFWTEPLSARFQRLFQISTDPDCLVAQVHQNGGWHINFKRTFGPQESASWNELQAELRSLQLTNSMDNVSWGLEPSGSRVCLLPDPFTANSSRVPQWPTLRTFGKLRARSK